MAGILKNRLALNAIQKRRMPAQGSLIGLRIIISRFQPVKPILRLIELKRYLSTDHAQRKQNEPIFQGFRWSRLCIKRQRADQMDTLPGLNIAMEILANLSAPLAVGILGLLLLDLMRLRKANLRALKVKEKSKHSC